MMILFFKQEDYSILKALLGDINSLTLSKYVVVVISIFENEFITTIKNNTNNISKEYCLIEEETDDDRRIADSKSQKRGTYVYFKFFIESNKLSILAL